LKPTSDCEQLDREVDLVGWDESSRGKLSTVASQGIVVVSYSHAQCAAELRVLSQCLSRSSRYQYTPYAERRTKVSQNQQQLQANLPLGANSLKGSLSAGKVLRADYQLGGVERLPIGSAIDSSQLSGECTGATHVVSAIYRGAFAIGATSRDKVEAATHVIGASSSSALTILMQAGDEEACRRANGSKPAFGCDVPLRIELLPLAVEQELSVPLPQPRSDRPWSKSAPKLEVPSHGQCPKGMAYFEGGKFTRGADNGVPIEGPAHPEQVPSFCLDATEVTVEAYRACMEASICPTVTDGLGAQSKCNNFEAGKAAHPQNCVKFEPAEDYCRWLGKRLPTEGEWEFAAKAGARNLSYATGAAPTAATACIGRTNDTTCPVASKPREVSGVFGLSGNVAEFTSTGYVEYPGSRDPGGSAADVWTPVSKGGSFYDDNPFYFRTSRRDNNVSALGQGFRCAY
jgi:formylglycine-generating enzyme required for sulfatase activity